MEPSVFALPVSAVFVVGTLNQVDITTNVSGSDGNGVPINFLNDFLWDCTQPAATNLANMKAGIIAQALQAVNVKLSSNNVNILMAVN